MQVCGTTQTIHRVLSDVRNQRGAHAEVNWTRNLPQPVRAVYAIYASWFVVEVGMYLIRQAALAAESETFRRAVFGADAEVPLPTGTPLPREGLRLSVEPEDEFALCFADAQNFVSCPYQGAGTTSYSTKLWFVRAPGDTTEGEEAGMAELLRIANAELSRDRAGVIAMRLASWRRPSG